MSLDKAFSLIQDSGGGASSKGKVLARFKKEYEGLTKIAPPFNLFIYMY